MVLHQNKQSPTQIPSFAYVGKALYYSLGPALTNVDLQDIVESIDGYA